MQTKRCSKCGDIKEIIEFNKQKKGKYGVRSYCRECQKKQQKKWRKKNPEYDRQWYKRNTEHKKESTKKWRENNSKRKTAHENNRRAMKHALPYSTSSELWLDVIMEYDSKCAVTGKDKFDLEHAIPISWGWGGSLKNNIYPLCSSLNGQKSSKNPFKFMEQLKGQQRVKFEQVLRNLAKENGLTYKEYRKFVNWCEKNKRTLEQVLEDNKLGLTHVELWRLRTKQSN